MKIAILGYGIVGRGVGDLIHQNRAVIRKNAGEELTVKTILDIRDLTGDLHGAAVVREIGEVISDPEIDLVVEAMGGLEPAFRFVAEALRAGKSVVTSNKELVAEKGDVLIALARENHCSFRFEASTGGGIPLLQPIAQCLGANEIRSITGILNGTTNYILEQMFTEKKSFADALSGAQQLGYAERDPSADIEGKDACRKICILSSLVFGSHIYPSEVYTEGITAITKEDVSYASKIGCVIKLIARSTRREDGKLEMMVAPHMVPASSVLGNLHDSYNGVRIDADAAETVHFTGRGAGAKPTASAVVSDCITVCRQKTSEDMSWGFETPGKVAPMGEYQSRSYLRFRTDREDLEDCLRKLWGKYTKISEKKSAHEMAIITPNVSELDYARTAEKMTANGIQILGRIRILPE